MKLRNRVAAVALGLLISITVFAGLESATYIHELVATNPVGATDPKSQGDDHVRMIKATLLNTFPNVEGVVTSSHTQLNYLNGDVPRLSQNNTFTGVAQQIAGDEARFVVADAAINGILQASTDLSAVRIGATTNHNLRIDTNNAARLTIANNGDTNLGLNGGPVTVNSGFDLRTLAGGTYTPSAFNAINCGVTPNKHFYTRVGNIVTVTGASSINITSAGLSTNFELSLPIASNLTATTDLAGNGSNEDTGAETVRANANTINDRAQVIMISVSTGLGTLYYTFSYEIK